MKRDDIPSSVGIEDRELISVVTGTTLFLIVSEFMLVSSDGFQVSPYLKNLDTAKLL